MFARLQMVNLLFPMRTNNKFSNYQRIWKTRFLRVNNGEDLLDITALCVDPEQNIWTGHFQIGTIAVLTPEFYKNEVKRIEAPVMRFDHND